MDAIVFDFDGVIADSEPVHMACFQRVLAGRGVTLSKQDYCTKYLGYDDHDCFLHVLADSGKSWDEPLLAELTAAKTAMVQEMFRSSIQALPGAVALIRSIRAVGVPLAICSGALRAEIELAASTIGVLDAFGVIVAAKDVSAGKPDPEGYRKALAALGRVLGAPLRAEKCVAIEDSPAGIASAKGAGMKVCAVTTSYPAAELTAADLVVPTLEQVTPTRLDELTSAIT